MVVAHAPHSWDPKKHKKTQPNGIEVEDAETQSVQFWEHLTGTFAKRPLPHCPLVLLADANIELSHAQICYRGVGGHHAAREAISYAGVFFAEFVETHKLALPSTFRTCHEGPRRTFAGNFGQRRIDFVGVPFTWLAGVATSNVLGQFDTHSTRDHFAVLVSVRGHIDSRESVSRAPRLDAHWIWKRDPTELSAALTALASAFLLAWHLDVHAHRPALIQIVKEATEAVKSQKVKILKPYVSFEVVAISRLRACLLNRRCRSERHLRTTDQLRICLLWK